jgi:hypothetical protein
MTIREVELPLDVLETRLNKLLASWLLEKELLNPDDELTYLAGKCKGLMIAIELIHKQIRE